MGLYSYDQVIAAGKVGKDAEMRFTPTGTPVTSFSLAVDRGYKDKATGEVVKRTIWYRVSVWGAFAETCSTIRKGDTVMVSGSLEADWSTGSPKLWEKSDGSYGASNELRANVVRFLGRKQDSDEVPRQPTDEDEFPF